MSDNKDLGPTVPELMEFSIAIPTTHPIMLLIKHWKAILLSVILASAGLYIGWQHLKISNLQVQLGKQEFDLVHYKHESVKCKENYESLVDSIKDLSEQSKELQTSITALTPTISKINKNTSDTVSRIINSQTPASCQEAIQFLRDNIKR